MRRSEPIAWRARACSRTPSPGCSSVAIQGRLGGSELEPQLEQPLQRRHARAPRGRVARRTLRARSPRACGSRPDADHPATTPPQQAAAARRCVRRSRSPATARGPHPPAATRPRDLRPVTSRPRRAQSARAPRVRGSRSRALRPARVPSLRQRWPIRSARGRRRPQGSAVRGSVRARSNVGRAGGHSPTRRGGRRALRPVRAQPRLGRPARAARLRRALREARRHGRDGAREPRRGRRGRALRSSLRIARGSRPARPSSSRRRPRPGSGRARTGTRGHLGSPSARPRR